MFPRRTLSRPEYRSHVNVVLVKVNDRAVNRKGVQWTGGDIANIVRCKPRIYLEFARE